MPQIIDGKAMAQQVKREAMARVAALHARQMPCGLAVVLVGDDPASAVYVRNKRKDCVECGIWSHDYDLPADCTQEELHALLEKLNADPQVSGVLVQFPLPAHLDEEAAVAHIDPRKDVDGLHPYNLGHLMRNLPGFRPCTPDGVMRLLDEYHIDLAGKTAVIIGRSVLVGKPLALMLQARDATVIACHSKTPDVASFTRQADILISAMGKPEAIDASWIKPGAVVIDVGMNRNAEGKLCGDIDFDSVSPLCSAITPVPGGVGPMTRAMLMLNTVIAAEQLANL